MSAAPSYAQDGTMAHLPPLIDCHVHFREPGLEHKGDIASESTAAYYGGISAACDMPNTAPPTQSIAALADKVARATATAHADCRLFFFFGATAEEHLKELEELWTNPTHADLKQHCCGLKLYLDNSTGNMKSSVAVTEKAFELCGRLQIVLVAHCEQSQINDAAAAQHPYDGPASHSLRRPAESEAASVQEAIAFARQHRTPLHLAHVSTAQSLDAVRETRLADPTLPLTCEVTPHHLFLTTEDYSCCGARVKVNPPVRLPQHHEALWAGLLDGTVDCVGTDHAPHTLDEKNTAGQPPSGMPAIEVVVPLLLTVVAGRWPHPTAPRPTALVEAAQRGRTLRMEDIVRVLHTNPNRIFHLGEPSAPHRSFDLSCAWTVVGTELHSKCRWTPYEGWQLLGRAVSH
ncbi:putative Dihydroorotase [Leptomonas pyrrhocoris]|uniref:Putative Dihydroorotase n=1 Tax=Leptomonas pyrrhocoris TaxID=157538 RepID=A0A0M9FX97_LEPPY|nr:putative Dihydroorotase [Leptomonas pyrrhocoris]XP_015656293.1 putative Dihydroorotase [Leptomonas pyrrhocoris]KPA77853.1 putative Dihydroorotase [Leptomonas pyrrhocoris]KPA77854.1 putative Dihydroorotase [Leptomonas pyrrhocoris]|eukprot:XP_015656292.1 putative Dihydroorotase [Leptomonas pyrrhocoris]